MNSNLKTAVAAALILFDNSNSEKNTFRYFFLPEWRCCWLQSPRNPIHTTWEHTFMIKILTASRFLVLAEGLWDDQIIITKTSQNWLTALNMRLETLFKTSRRGIAWSMGTDSEAKLPSCIAGANKEKGLTARWKERFITCVKCFFFFPPQLCHKRHRHHCRWLSEELKGVRRKGRKTLVLLKLPCV